MKKVTSIALLSLLLGILISTSFAAQTSLLSQNGVKIKSNSQTKWTWESDSCSGKQDGDD